KGLLPAIVIEEGTKEEPKKEEPKKEDKKPEPTPGPAPVPGVIGKAQQYLGLPYVWGSASPSNGGFLSSFLGSSFLGSSFLGSSF
ncbi:hypothetical protein ACT453_53075, partial [Bacillus sp. D-CC]